MKRNFVKSTFKPKCLFYVAIFFSDAIQSLLIKYSMNLSIFKFFLMNKKTCSIKYNSIEVKNIV